MWKFPNAFALVVVLSITILPTLAQTVTARLHFSEGEPRKGAFCTDDEKYVIMESITDRLVEMQSSKIPLEDYDEWCPSLCFPGSILFCQLMAERCRDVKERRKLSVDTTETVGQYATAGEVDDTDESVVIFTDEEANGDRRRRLRRVLQSDRFIEDLSEAEKTTCNDIKGPLMRAISNELGGKLDKLCIRLLRQKLMLDCVLFT